MPDTKPMRIVRSFVRREGRITSGQEKALNEHWSQFGVDWSDTTLDFEQLFGRKAPLNLEIGFGKGDSVISMAKAFPEEDFVGIEVFRPGAGHVIAQALEQDLNNIKLLIGDAVDILGKVIADNSFDHVYIFFSDPWHKKKHHKRRLINPEFVSLLANKIKPGGDLFLATDWQNYAEQMLEVLNAHKEYKNEYGNGFATRNKRRPLTKFEARGQRLGHGVWDLHYTCTKR